MSLEAQLIIFKEPIVENLNLDDKIFIADQHPRITPTYFCLGGIKYPYRQLLTCAPNTKVNFKNSGGSVRHLEALNSRTLLIRFKPYGDTRHGLAAMVITSPLTSKDFLLLDPVICLATYHMTFIGKIR